jgi:hypothetical protein
MRWRPHFDFLVAHASFVPLPPFMMELLEKMAEDRNLLTEFFGLIEGIEECLGFFTRQQSLEFRVSAGNTLAARMDL